jgi:hypothetical protein
MADGDIKNVIGSMPVQARDVVNVAAWLSSGAHTTHQQLQLH